jgi:iron(III) transport system ATP-binding protein
VSDPAWRPLTGESATLSVRPECWRIELAKPAQNSAAGRIGESIYLGEVAQYAFQTDSGVALKIFELNPDLTRRPQDRELYATADPDDVVVLRK